MLQPVRLSPVNIRCGIGSAGPRQFGSMKASPPFQSISMSLVSPIVVTQAPVRSVTLALTTNASICASV